MERVILSKEQLISADIGKRKPGTIHIGRFYVPFDFAPYIAADEMSLKKLLNFQKELFKGVDKSNDNWIYQIETNLLEEIKWVIV